MRCQTHTNKTILYRQQEKAVKHYFSAHDPGYKSYESNNVEVSNNDSTTIGESGGIYNRIGRGYPDVSSNGVNFATYWIDLFFVDKGTSYSAPTWASIIAMLNAERAAVGKGPVGLIQPVLYQHPEVFNDIRNGSNPGCETDGFEAVEGWDPVSSSQTFHPLKSAMDLADSPLVRIRSRGWVRRIGRS